MPNSRANRRRLLSALNGQRAAGVMLGQKQKLAAGNSTSNDLAHSLNFFSSSGVRAANNREVTKADVARCALALADQINTAYSREHPAARRLRFEAATLERWKL